MVNPVLEAELSSKSIGELEADLLYVFWHYLRDKLHNEPKYVIRHLDHMTSIIDFMRKACERGECPPSDTDEKHKAHEARRLGWALIRCANLVGQGKGGETINEQRTGKSFTYRDRPVTVLDWVDQFLRPDAHPILQEMLKQDDHERILQWKVDLLGAFTEARKLYNAYRPRADSKDPASTHDRKSLGRREAGKLITEAMRVVYRCQVRPLPRDVEGQAQEALERVLTRAEAPLAAVIPLVQRLAKDKLGKSICADTVRQAAEYERDKPPRSNGLPIKINGVPRIRTTGGVAGAIGKAWTEHQLWKNTPHSSQRKKRSAKPAISTD